MSAVTRMQETCTCVSVMNSGGGGGTFRTGLVDSYEVGHSLKTARPWH